MIVSPHWRTDRCVEHMRGLERLLDEGFRFVAVPPTVKAFGTFPVRAFAVLSL
jgi:kynurenine formamidase